MEIKENVFLLFVKYFFWKICEFLVFQVEKGKQQASHCSLKVVLKPDVAFRNAYGFVLGVIV